MYLIIILLPLISCSLIMLFGRYVGSYTAVYSSITNIVLTGVLSIIAFYEVVFANCPVYLECANWILLFNNVLTFSFTFDTLTIIMILLITFISILVYIYSFGYMINDPHITRFMAYLSILSLFMLILVSSGNFVQSFSGWEGVGLSSYSLTNSHTTRIQANKAALKAIFVNRISDCFLLIGIVMVFIIYGSLDWQICSTSTFESEKNININFMFIGLLINKVDLICFMFPIAAVGKSAQVPLHIWLPDAMEGPTPVSALLHAATTVTAGIYSLARTSTFIEMSLLIKPFIVIIGSVTASIGATIATFQHDIKKIIAYSTCSQLGYMMLVTGLSSYDISIYHSFNHGFFKALPSPSAGCIIHAMANEQDIRRMGGLSNSLPLCYQMILIASLPLAGFPFSSGFYSKDLIIETAYASYNGLGSIAFCSGSLSAFSTSFYSLRLLYIVFIIRTNCYKCKIENLHEFSIFTYNAYDSTIFRISFYWLFNT